MCLCLMSCMYNRPNHSLCLKGMPLEVSSSARSQYLTRRELSSGYGTHITVPKMGLSKLTRNKAEAQNSVVLLAWKPT